MSNARLTIEGLDEAQRLTEDVQKRLRDMSPALRAAAEEFKTLTDDSFEAQAAPSGAGWEPLKEATLRRRRGGGGRILIDTGRLRNSLTAVAQATALRVGQITGGATPKYARVHQFGSAKQNIPARPFLPFTVGGTLMGGARVARAVERMRRYISSYVKTGKVQA